MLSLFQDDFYLPLKDVKNFSVGIKINLIAKIIEIGIPRKSKGSDHYLTLKLVDETVPTPGFSVNIFENPIKLPKIRYPGDIISLHCVELQSHEEVFFCIYKKGISSFACFDGKADGKLAPYQTSSAKRYMAANDDERLIVQLRASPLSYQQEEHRSILLCNIEPDRELDLVCKVLDVREISDGFMVLVWDGTDAPPVALQTDLDMEATMPIHYGLSLLSREILLTLPEKGSFMEIIISKMFGDISQLKGGSHWVKFYDIIINVQSGIWKGLVQAKSKIRIVSAENSDVLLRERIYRDRFLSDEASWSLSYCPDTSSLTVTDFEPWECSTLRKSLTCPEDLHVFKTVVRVMAAYPWRAEDLCSPDGVYRVRLTLEDATGRILAYVYEEDGEKFFDGYPSYDVLTKKMNMILGIGEDITASRNPPWITCCLKSYYVERNDPCRSYRMFGTKFIG